MKGRQRSTMLVLLFFFAMVAFAVPAKPGFTRTLTITDGSTVNAMLVGDEYLHYWLGDDGKAYQAVSQQKRGAKGGSEDGDAVYQAFDVEAAKKSADERRSNANQQRARRLAPRKVGSVGNISGEKKGIIILVNFKDKAFTATQSDFYNLANTVNYNSGNFKGSMYDYFYAQSDGQFRLTFDVVGPYTVSKNYAYYGANDSNGSDVHPAEMVIEAVKLADNDVNFANYDWDNDGFVDQVYVVYAGKGEADGGAEDTIWPHEYDLYSANYYGDGEGIQILDDVKIKTYACGGEQNGSTGETAGIGTMCHEFSHCLGYPDFYDTDYSGGQGMGYWDLMNSGSYNGNGYRPAGYTSYERWVAGWKTPIELKYTQTISNMAALQTTGSNSYIIYNKGNSNEYYLLENRQKTGWDTNLPGAGLLILHVDYDADVWSHNKPNDDPAHQRMTWIAADNEYQYNLTSNGKKSYTRAGMANDPFPYGSVNSFGKNSKPAATLYNANSDGTYYLDSSITDITQNSDGTISFNFKGIGNVYMPNLSPEGGRFAKDQTVTVTITAETGATIYYTTNGNEPTTASTLYTAPFTVTTTTTVKAIAVKDGEESGVATATYTFVDPLILADESLSFSAVTGSSETKQLTVLTEGLTQDITLTLTDANNVFSLGTTTISKSLEDATVGITFSPTKAGSYAGTITLKSAGAKTVTVILSGIATTASAILYETIDFTAQGYENETTVESVDGTCCSVTFDKGSNKSNAPKYYTNGTAIRMYGGNTMTIASTTKKIAKIEITFGSSDGSNEITTDEVTYSNGTWTGSASSVTFTISGTSGNRRIRKVKVTYDVPYYKSADGKMGAALKTELCGIIYNRREIGYDDLWTAYQTTDVRSDGKIWDMYSNVTDYDPVNGSHANTAEGSGFSREHSFPKSWFGGEIMPMFTDLHHIYPVDANINTRRNNNPYGETNGEDYKSAHDFSKIGACTYPGYSGKVFEPADEYKGDFARTFFYMVTCYEDKLHDWYNDNSFTEVREVLEGNPYPGLSEWQLNMLMKWAKNDPVSEKEINRNNAVYAIQNNRNPFIDYPGLEEYIWGSLTNSAFSYDNYVQPVFKQDVTMSFSPAEATATIGMDFTKPTLTTDPTGLTVTYSSNDEEVATVDSSTGEVTLVAAGTTTISASFAGNDSYNGSLASYTLTVSDASAVGSGNFALVTDASTLAAGDKILIAYVDGTTAKALGAQNSNNRDAVDVTKNTDNTLTSGSNAQVITLEKDGDNYLFNVGNGYLYAASNNNNYLKTETKADDNAKATISISNGSATITFQGENTHKIIRYNPNTSNNNPLFSCYTSGSTTGSLPQIYREVLIPLIALNNSGTGNAGVITTYDNQTVCVTLAGRTLYKDGAWNTLTLPFALSAEQIAASDLAGADIRTLSTASFSGGTLTLNFTPETGEGAVTEITAGTPYIIKWADSNSTIKDPVFSGVTIDKTVRDKVCDLDDGYSISFCGTYEKLTYNDDDPSILFIGAGNTLYYPLSGTSIGAQRAYFQLNGIEARASAPNNGDGPVRAFVLNFGDDKSNGIENVHSPMFNVPSEGWYTLDGRRLSGKPTKKGIYVNGNRKVLIK
ncbi:MAG: endonuclease [Prevotella sp.]|nr:endonuclease [Prevotella sp.]